MKNIVPYLIIPNRCEEALKFYELCFAGKTTVLQRFSDVGYDVAEKFKMNIAHAEFEAGELKFMTSDGMPDDTITQGNNLAMSITVTEKATQEHIFSKLSQGGKITMEFQETSMNSSLGTLIDKFGFHWYINLMIK